MREQRVDFWLIVWLCVVVIAFLCTRAFCADIPLKWDASAGARGYVIQMSADGGQSWGEERDAGDATDFIWTGAPDIGVLLFRVAAYNDGGKVIRTEAGAWFCGAWKLPTKPGGLGVN